MMSALVNKQVCRRYDGRLHGLFVFPLVILPWEAGILQRGWQVVLLKGGGKHDTMGHTYQDNFVTYC
jgi:hypothetical protein